MLLFGTSLFFIAKITACLAKLSLRGVSNLTTEPACRRNQLNFSEELQLVLSAAAFAPKI